MKNLLLLMTGLLFLSSCNRNKKCKDINGSSSGSFTFEIPYSVAPSKDTFKVGDTIWIESSFSNQLYNKLNGKTYTLNDFNFKMFGFISDLKTNPCVATNAFIMVNSDGQVYDTDRDGVYYHFNFKMLNDSYTWKAGFIMTQPGLYDLSMGTDIILESIGSQSPSQHITECDHEWVSLEIKRGNTNNNHYLLQDAADPYIKSAPSDYGGYAFYVKP